MRKYLLLILFASYILFDCSVEAECRTLRGEELKKEVVSALKQKSTANGYELLVKSVTGLSDIDVPEGRIVFDVVSPENLSAKRVTASLIIRIDGAVYKNIPVACTVEEWGDFVAAFREIERGEIISSDMLTIERKVRLNAYERHPLSVEEAVGKKAKRRIRKNENLSMRDLEKVMLMKPGQIVTILAENDLIRLTATAKTKGGGAVGDFISVQNLTSNVELSGRIVDSKTVKVDF